MFFNFKFLNELGFLLLLSFVSENNVKDVLQIEISNIDFSSCNRRVFDISHPGLFLLSYISL